MDIPKIFDRFYQSDKAERLPREQGWACRLPSGLLRNIMEKQRYKAPLVKEQQLKLFFQKPKKIEFWVCLFSITKSTRMKLSCAFGILYSTIIVPLNICIPQLKVYSPDLSGVKVSFVVPVFRLTLLILKSGIIKVDIQLLLSNGFLISSSTGLPFLTRITLGVYPCVVTSIFTSGLLSFVTSTFVLGTS